MQFIVPDISAIQIDVWFKPRFNVLATVQSQMVGPSIVKSRKQ